MNNDDDVYIQTLFDGELFSVHRVEEDGDVEINLSLFGTITLHFEKDEWNDFLDAMHSLHPED